MFRPATLSLLLISYGLAGVLCAAENIENRFAGSQSCSTSGCHGGGVGKDQFQTWQKKDVHTRAYSKLATGRSAGIAEKLGIHDATKSARCTVCHAPLLSVSPAMFADGAKADTAVSCETCHGPGERWLRSHTRTDYTHDMRLAAGMRDLGDLYSRANSCVACHQNIDSALLGASHPEMFFELDSQMAGEPPHWKDEGTWLGPRAWLTGQAAVLREISWALTKTPGDPALQPRWQALVWLLRKTPAGRALPEGGAAGEMQSAADRLARTASKEPWTRESTMQLLQTLAGLGGDFRDSKFSDVDPIRRRGEVVALAVNRAWAALKSEGKLTSTNLDTAVDNVGKLASAQLGFDRVKFAAALEQVEVNLEVLGKP